MSPRRLTIALAGALAVAAFAVTSALAGNTARPAVANKSHAAAAKKAHAAAAAKPYRAQFSYAETNPGHTHGQTTTGIVGKGKFSGKLSMSGALEAAFITVVTGVPVSKIAEGGSYVERWTSEANGNAKGIVVARLKAHGLGTVCISYVTKHGKFVLGQNFLPGGGSFLVLGGTGAAARWHGSASYKQTNVTGNTTEQFSVTGSEHGSIGKAHHMTAACKAVAKLH
jgi:hypothetical protein